MNPEFIRGLVNEIRPGKSVFRIFISWRKKDAPPAPYRPTRHVPDGGKHARVYVAGKKQDHIENRRPVEEEEKKPVFIPDMVPAAKRDWRRFFDIPTRLFGRSRTTEVDRDLVARLKFEAAFCVRDPLLARTLTNRARQFLADYDTHRLTADEIYSLSIRAVGEAMRISREEEDVRLLLRENANLTHIRRHAQFSRGTLHMPLFPDRRLPSRPQ